MSVPYSLLYDEKKLVDLFNIGDQPDLDEEEITALREDRRRNQTHLLRENILFFKNGIRMTKTMEDEPLGEFVRNVLSAINCDVRIYLGKLIISFHHISINN